MSKKEKLIEKLKSDSSFTWPELLSLMKMLDFKLIEGRGSRVKFERKGMTIAMHKPHPESEIKDYVRKEIVKRLKDELL
jgi:hypothetical protein